MSDKTSNPKLRKTKQTRNKPVKSEDELRTQVRNKFKTLFKLGIGKGNNFSRDNFITTLKREGLNFLDDNIKIIKDVNSYEQKYRKAMKELFEKKLFEKNKGSLTNLLDFSYDKQKNFVQSLENYVNKKSGENAKNFFETELKLNEEDITKLFRTEGAGMIPPPEIKKPEKMPDVKVKSVTPKAVTKVKELAKKTTDEAIEKAKSEITEERKKEIEAEVRAKLEAEKEEEKEDVVPATPPVETVQEPAPEPAPEPAQTPAPAPARKKEIEQTEIDVLKPLPSKSDFIPPERLGTKGKNIKELLEDVNYFLKNFKSQLKKESEFFKNINKSNLNQVRELHNRIVGKLSPSQSSDKTSRKVGVILDADTYIREQMKKILQEQTFSSLRPQDVIIDVGSREAEGRDAKDYGDFAVKRTVDGGLASQREAVFRYMPSENDPDIGEEGLSKKEKMKPKRLKIVEPRLNNRRTNALKMNTNNPFRVPQKTLKLKYLY